MLCREKKTRINRMTHLSYELLTSNVPVKMYPDIDYDFQINSFQRNIVSI